MTIYEKLYAEAAECMAGAGKAFSISLEAYAREGGKDPFVINIKEAAELKGKEYYQYFYYRYFNRIPKERLFQKYSNLAKVLKFNQETRFELLIANHISSVVNYHVRDKQVCGLAEYQKELRHQGIISRLDQAILWADRVITKVGTGIVDSFVQFLRMLLAQRTRERINQIIGRG